MGSGYIWEAIGWEYNDICSVCCIVRVIIYLVVYKEGIALLLMHHGCDDT